MDRSCNLKCPSCREDIIIEKNSTKIDKQIELYEKIKQWGLANPEKELLLLPTAIGEIFASHSGLQFLKSLIDYPYDNLKIRITTNGTLINRNRELIKNINHLIDSLSVSIDAATPETYSVVRGGDWTELMSGLEFVKSNITEKLNLSFCIQKNNYHEIEQFDDLADRFGATISYQKLADWGHWNIAWWHDNNVLDRTRDTFNLTLDSIECVQEKYPGLVGVAGDISKYLEQRKEK
jgi:MoaA/NifB/PqqE/SkfB family radical SAM enzyme